MLFLQSLNNPEGKEAAYWVLLFSLCIVEKILDLSRFRLQAAIQTLGCQPSQRELTDCEAITNTYAGQVKIGCWMCRIHKSVTHWNYIFLVHYRTDLRSRVSKSPTETELPWPYLSTYLSNFICKIVRYSASDWSHEIGKKYGCSVERIIIFTSD